MTYEFETEIDDKWMTVAVEYAFVPGDPPVPDDVLITNVLVTSVSTDEYDLEIDDPALDDLAWQYIMDNDWVRECLLEEGKQWLT